MGAAQLHEATDQLVELGGYGSEDGELPPDDVCPPAASPEGHPMQGGSGSLARWEDWDERSIGECPPRPPPRSPDDPVSACTAARVCA
jgi:hypothetical protein